MLIRSERSFIYCSFQLNDPQREFKVNPVIRLWRQMADSFFLAILVPTVSSWNGTLRIGIFMGLMVYSRGGLNSVVALRRPKEETSKCSQRCFCPFSHSSSSWITKTRKLSLKWRKSKGNLGKHLWWWTFHMGWGWPRSRPVASCQLGGKKRYFIFIWNEFMGTVLTVM